MPTVGTGGALPWSYSSREGNERSTVGYQVKREDLPENTLVRNDAVGRLWCSSGPVSAASVIPKGGL